ncbi:MAG: VCBS repeat-containing protein [Planctomycetota bacterium]|nr:VCBS repeat-containing protein [Planctomycetota bacterium]
MVARRVFLFLLVVSGLSASYSREASAQEGDPFQYFDVVLDSVSSECEKAFVGVRGLKVVLTAHIENASCPSASADILAAFPKFRDGLGNDVSSEYVVVASLSNPSTMDMNGTPVVLDFWVDVSPTAVTLGTITINGQIGTNAPSCSGAADFNADATDSWILMRPIKDHIWNLAWPPLTPVRSQNFGYAVATGNIDGNSLSGGDILASANMSDLFAPTYIASVGAAAVFYGDLTGGIPCPTVQYYVFDSDYFLDPVPQSNARFGEKVAAADVDGDGDDDIIISVENAEVAGTFGAGKVIVFYAPSFANYDVLIAPAHPTVVGRFGRSLATGNFDGMHGEDIAVGNPFAYAPGSSNWPGEVVLFLSDGTGTDGMGGFTEYVIPSPSTENQDAFGWSLAAGNIESLTRDSLVVGAINDGAAGRAHVYLDPTSGNPPMTLDHPNPVACTPFCGNFGWDVAVGDADGNGFADIAVVDPGPPVGQIPWTVFVYDESGALWTQLQGPNLGVTTWPSLAMGDIDLDGNNLADIVVGIPYGQPCGVDGAGEVFAFLNITVGPVETRYWFDSIDGYGPLSGRTGWAVAVGELDPFCPGAEVVVGLPRANFFPPFTSAGKVVVFQ